MAAFPEEEQDQNAETDRESDIGSGKPGLISNQAQSRLANRTNHSEHQRLHRDDGRPDVISYLILNPVQQARAYD